MPDSSLLWFKTLPRVKFTLFLHCFDVSPTIDFKGFALMKGINSFVGSRSLEG